MSDRQRQRVAVVTGGGGGIGAAIAEAISRTGTFVVTVDPLVSVDGSEQLPTPEETTAGRIVAAGRSARASSVSVTDAAGVRSLFEDLAQEFGGLDAVVNVAGITRPTSFARGTEEDWRSVLSVHLDGYLNILHAALPLMAVAGRGHVLGVTSGSGWRPADTGAYGCAKRAVAAITWQLGRHAPPGVVVNALSPIAATRMVTAALSRARSSAPPAGDGPVKPRSSATGGLSLASMPGPDELGPLGAHLVDDAFSACRGKVIFSGGSEIAVVEAPRLLEVVRTTEAVSVEHVLDTVTTRALVPAEANQASFGGSNARFAGLFTEAADAADADPAVRTCAIVTDRPALGDALVAALTDRGVRCHLVDAAAVGPGFDGASHALASAVSACGPLDALIIALAADRSAPDLAGWERVLTEHTGIAVALHADAAWARAVADYSASADHALRLLTLTDATTAGGRSRAQSAAQHARSARGSTDDRVSAFALSVETSWEAVPSFGEIVAHLLCTDDTSALSGAELAVGPGWFGLRSHPHPTGSIVFGGPELPDWFDDALAGIAGEEDR